MTQNDTGTQVNNSKLIFIADKVFGFPVQQMYGNVIYSHTCVPKERHTCMPQGREIHISA